MAKTPDQPTPSAPITERIAKRIAASGVCSRREAEKLIAEGQVKVNGALITSPALNVSEADQVLVRGKPIFKPASTRLWLYHKPAGLLTTNKDPEGRPTIFSQLPSSLPRVITVGRLDMNSEGLLLLTNSGDLARTLELPKTMLPRTYKVRLFGKISEKDIQRLDQGITVEGVRYGSIKVEGKQETASNSWVEVTLHEGKNREIRKVFDHLGHTVSRLIRISYGPFKLDDLIKSHVKEIPLATLQRLLAPHGIKP